MADRWRYSAVVRSNGSVEVVPSYGYRTDEFGRVEVFCCGITSKTRELRRGGRCREMPGPAPGREMPGDAGTRPGAKAEAGEKKPSF